MPLLLVFVCEGKRSLEILVQSLVVCAIEQQKVDHVVVLLLEGQMKRSIAKLAESNVDLSLEWVKQQLGSVKMTISNRYD